MAKNTKKQRQARESYSSTNEVHYPVSVPDPVNMDVLSVMSDEELISRAQGIASDRLKVLEGGYDPVAWEIELCYTQREFQMRRTRRDSHEKFLKEQVKLASDDEADLPSAEFDNLRYVMVN